MAKNIVICLDGTGNEIKATAQSSVLKLLDVLDLDDPLHQVAYYGPGVGTFSARSAWSLPARSLSKLGGLVVGNGMRQSLEDAYAFLVDSWYPEDRVFIFGFSRGAFTARALAGLVHRIGLLRKGSENLVPYAVKVYARRRRESSDLDGREGWARMDAVSAALSRRIRGRSLSMPVHFLGLFDTVKATSILGRDLNWPYTRSLPNVAEVWHAVSIDERRRPYREYLVQPGQRRRPVLNETWFAGVHSDIGGSFSTAPELGKISLRWMLDGAIAAGLLVRPRRLQASFTISPEYALGTIHRPGRVWKFVTSRSRVLPPGSRVHASVRDRIAVDSKYAAKLPAEGVVWDSRSWIQ